ncbi:MAG: multiheme c-type cytochrome [Myxococcales bacterium]
MLERWRTQGERVLLFDCGDLLASPTLPASDLDEARERAVLVDAVLARLGLAAAVPGEGDLALGPELLRELARRDGLTLLAANLRDAGQPLFPGSTVVRSGDLRVGVVGLFSPSLCPPGLTAGDPVAAARAELARLPRVDLTVVLAHEPMEEDAPLAAALPQVDVLIAAHGGVPEPTARLDGHAVRARTGNKNRFLGRIEASLGLAGGISGRLVPLDEDIRGDKEIEAQLRSYREAADTREIARLTPRLVATPENTSYAGEVACERCHAKAAAVWRGTAHAHAYATLEQAGHALDADCVGCHSTGFREPGGFSQPAAIGFLGGVQCEACHGPGKVHAARPLAPYPQPAAGEALCQRCHTQERSASFVYQTFHERVRHSL